MSNAPTITSEIRQTGSGPVPHHDGWEANHWEVTLFLNGDEAEITVPYYTGYGIDSQPAGLDVLSALLMDAATVENDDFDGFDGMKPSAIVRTWQLMEEQTRKLREFLGDHYEAALWENLFDTDDR